jgi:hypothetical protein
MSDRITNKDLEGIIKQLPETAEGKYGISQTLSGYRLVISCVGGGERELTAPMTKKELYNAIGLTLEVVRRAK